MKEKNATMDPYLKASIKVLTVTALIGILYFLYGCAGTNKPFVIKSVRIPSTVFVVMGFPSGPNGLVIKDRNGGTVIVSGRIRR